MDKIVVGIDGSPAAESALHWALDVAGETGAAVIAVLAFSFDLAWIGIGSDYQGRWIEKVTAKAQMRLHGILDAVAPPPRSVTVRRSSSRALRRDRA
ncbi:MAG TPA: universal stress protein [Acidimicrobiia bacterium]|nr:universal stress protein [Acidimicrobiia bacterium]